MQARRLQRHAVPLTLPPSPMSVYRELLQLPAGATEPYWVQKGTVRLPDGEICGGAANHVM